MILLLIAMFLFGCIGISHAYEDPRWEKSVPKQSMPTKKVKEPIVNVVEVDEDNMTRYEKEKLNKTLSTLKESPMPLRLPDTILRVMFLPYVDTKNVLRNSYYAFLKVEDGKWVLGEYLSSPDTRKSAKARVFTPLQAPLPEGAKEEKKDNKQTEKTEKEAE